MKLEKKQIEFLKNIDKNCIHGKNIFAKRNKNEINIFYEKYKKFYNLMQSNNIQKKIKEFISYKEFVKKNNMYENQKLKFSAQSKLESSIIEEFLFHLFKEFISKNINVGSVKAYNNLYFSPLKFENFKKENYIKINQKNQDFAIYKNVELSDNINKYCLSVPVVSIECKTYLDKTMLEGSIATAEKIKSGNPHCKFFILTETYEVDYKVDPSTSRIDNIFVIKKGGRRERNNKFSCDVIYSLYQEVKKHLTRNWSDIENKIKTLGIIF